MCLICGTFTSSKGNLELHTKKVHQQLRFPCSQCDFQAFQNSQLKKHIELQHDSDIEVLSIN